MHPWLYVFFFLFVIAALAFDLFIAHRKPEAMTIRKAAAWTVFWVALALVFNVLVYFIYTNHWFGAQTFPLPQGPEVPLNSPTSGFDAAMKFFAGYLLEQSLSVDNLFVIALIFAYFQVETKYQHRVLFWGILGAIILRGLMIGIGIGLLSKFHWVMYVFAGLLIMSAIKMLRSGDDEIHPDRNPLVRLARYFFPVTGYYEGEKFFTRVDGKRAITPLFLVLLVVESTDVMFAFDSIPAIIGITSDYFLVISSNVFAILGLRSLFFVLAGMMDKFKYLKLSLVVLLFFIGIKMILPEKWHISTPISLGVIAVILALGLIASLVFAPEHGKEAEKDETGEVSTPPPAGKT